MPILDRVSTKLEAKYTMKAYIRKKWHSLHENLVEQVCCSPHYMWIEREHNAKATDFFTHFRDFFIGFVCLHRAQLLLKNF
jgi:hypothetical protein